MADIKAGWVKVPNGELQIDAYLSEPITDEIVPGVIVIQEIFGVNAHIRDVTGLHGKDTGRSPQPFSSAPPPVLKWATQWMKPFWDENIKISQLSIGSNQRRQITSNSAPVALNRSLPLNGWAADAQSLSE